ncbi:transposase [Mesorhizobium sp.]|uniref:transposase n=1 Tax=unclassified Mesorhizobium TaxID=325217 RepID=UPI000FCA44A6|nr:hypothetical protein EN781_00505 [Mesorhizobium sp. M4A.F.Ca.ET.090.04.2.1]RWD53819.1 MAG: hypothetical protein EOS75_25445 [Mesorhizobium sp.]RWJ22634.1 MAG: hypothetical protein EOR27_20830 [Mesorhizobium sp.]RWN15580.1 MAG: hypothetical protein EOR87_03925 [Mesorhizobium sp.]RWN21069.1 MAG: hypothetical protein EOR88_08695 [Mesorhizobium sp.]
MAALAGLAPSDNKSGNLNHRCQIAADRAVRRALYMAALGASRACDRSELSTAPLRVADPPKTAAVKVWRVSV